MKCQVYLIHVLLTELCRFLDLGPLRRVDAPETVDMCKSSMGIEDACILGHVFFKDEATAIMAKARATAEGLEKVSAALSASGGINAASLKIAEQYLEVRLALGAIIGDC